MRLTRVFELTVLLLAGVAVAATVTLVMLSSLLHRVAADLETNVDGIHAAETLEAQVLLHNRVATRALVTGEPEFPVARDGAERAVRAQLAAAERLASSPEETALVAVAGQRVRAYLDRRAELERAGAGTVETLRAKGPYLETALESLDALVQLNLEQARAARARARRWDALSNVLGVAAAVALLAGGLGALALFRRLAVGPAAAINAALQRYAQGDKGARAPERGAAELAGFARTFNEMADSLARQRQEQLAFLGGVAHDLRNPLAPIKMGIAAVSLEQLDRERARRTLRTVARQVDRLERMATDLLDMARVEAGELELRLELCDGRALLDDLLELHRCAENELVPSFPAEPVPLRCDPGRIEQVLTNLLNNAMKYSPRGSSIELGLTRDGEDAVFWVSDQGPGIAPADQERIFEPFRRVGGRTACDVPGVGLGLAVTRRIVLAHGGRVEVSSAPGQGATFRVRLTLASAPEAAALARRA